MISICFYFQVHQPYRLKKNYSFFDIGANHFYEDVESNREICNKVSKKCYIPTNRLMLDLINRYKGKFKISYSISGVAIEQFRKYNPEVLDLFKELADTGCVEFICETYYHSLSFLFSRKEFRDQVEKHRQTIRDLFSQEAETFRNTELIYNNDIAKEVESMGFSTMLAEGADQVLGWRSPNFMYKPVNCYKLNLLLKNYKLSDDIAFRFSNRGWEEYPLVAEKYAEWLKSLRGNGEIINLFMDYETFGEHQWEDTGIFNFLDALPQEVFNLGDFNFITPKEAKNYYSPMGKLDVGNYVSWADMERDLTAWVGNPLQDSAIEMVYSMEEELKKYSHDDLIDIWRKLQTSDHFYYMCTKWFSDGDVHKYFNPYSTPYDAFIVYSNVLNDLKETLKQREANYNR